MLVQFSGDDRVNNETLGEIVMEQIRIPGKTMEPLKLYIDSYEGSGLVNVTYSFDTIDPCPLDTSPSCICAEKTHVYSEDSGCTRLTRNKKFLEVIFLFRRKYQCHYLFGFWDKISLAKILEHKLPCRGSSQSTDVDYDLHLWSLHARCM